MNPDTAAAFNGLTTCRDNLASNLETLRQLLEARDATIADQTNQLQALQSNGTGISQADLDAARAQANDLQAQLAAANSQIAALQQELATLNAAIDQAQQAAQPPAAETPAS